MYFDASYIPEYIYSSYRSFREGEHHVTRVCDEDVIVMVFSGVLRFTENGAPIEVGRGEYYIQQKGLFQSGDTVSDSPYYYYIHMSCRICESSGCFIPRRGKFDMLEIKRLADRLEAVKHDKNAKIELNAAFLSVLSALIRSAEEPRGTANDIAEYISGHLSEQLTLDSISKKFGYCKNHIMDIFKSAHGMTIHSFLIMKRIDLAKNLLSSSELSVYEIALRSGFSSYINMYKSFMRWEGHPPCDFRAGQK